MPNIKISDLPNVTLPLDVTNVFLEVQAVEAGVDVSRKVSADDLASSALGLDATFITVSANPNLPNERILTAGTGIGIVDGGAGNPITINVTGGGNPFATPLGVLGDINTATPPTTEAITDLLEFRDNQDVNTIGSIGYNAANEILIQNEMRGGGIRIRGRLTSAGALTTFFQGLPDSFTFIGSPGALSGDGKDMFLTTGDGATGPDSGGDLILETGRGAGSGTPGLVKIEQGNLFFAEHAAAITQVAGYGQFWVRDDVPNVPMFTNDVGTDFVLNAVAAAPEKLVDPAANDAMVAEGLGIVAMRSVGNIDAEDRSIEWQHQDGTTQFSIGNEFFTDMILRNHIAGRHIIANVGTGGGSRIRLHLSGDATSGGVSLYAGASASPVFQTDLKGCHMSRGTLFMDEQAAQEAFVVGQGQFWVRDDAPNTPMFTDDVGTDFVLNAAAVIPDPLIIGSINLTSALSAGSSGGSYDDVPINIGANLVGTMPMTQLSRQRIQTKPSSASFNATLFINTGGAGTAGADTIIGSLNGAQLEVSFGVDVTMKHGLSGTEIFSTIDTGILLPEGSVFIDEKAAAEANVAARGEFWVRNDAPNTPMFTTDTGVDIDLSTPAAAVPIVLLDTEQIQFGTGTDVTMDWNGTEFDIAFAAAASVMRIRDGVRIQLFAPNDVDNTFIQQLADRTNVISSLGGGFWQFNPELRILSGGLTFGTAGVIEIRESGGDMRIDLGTTGDFRLRGGNTGVDIMIEATSDAGVALYHDNARRFETIAIQVDGAISGAILDDADGNMLHVGFQEQIWILQDTVLGTTDNVWRDAAGHILYSTDVSAETYTTPAAADAVVPDGYWVDIINLGVGAITVAEGVGVTLTHLDGVGATGSLSIAQFGKMRLHKRTGALWYASNTVDVS